jgi:negative regulator of flagellin synthesis FlgM
MNTSPINPARPVAGAWEQAAAGSTPKPAETRATPVAGQSAVAVQTLDDADAQPVNPERVALIRKAIEDGRYPIVPAKIADAMIAAGLFLRATK